MHHYNSITTAALLFLTKHTHTLTRLFGHKKWHLAYESIIISQQLPGVTLELWLTGPWPG